MNTMLIAVTERTREIGLRLALGARKRGILTQFLVESITLCVIGNLIGVSVVVIASGIIAAVSSWPMLWSVPTIVLAISSAAFVGVFFGYYPARKASNLNLIDVLRFE
jgi:ABC-type antimicrobial peptide transport system permease subunit